jgi:hypothetical protein
VENKTTTSASVTKYNNTSNSIEAPRKIKKNLTNKKYNPTPLVCTMQWQNQKK